MMGLLASQAFRDKLRETMRATMARPEMRALAASQGARVGRERAALQRKMRDVIPPGMRNRYRKLTRSGYSRPEALHLCWCEFAEAAL